ncbi:ribosomal protein S18-alanine N-acetyltransferase [Thermococcus gammatolerans]|uniref:Ribosomal-protein-alanine acetyltransferase (RimI) n=1 Tax=Thermococcus gammatolerans (strain DSM 15229 / JCM 11827 / EJ3) TaxID=593117 RepID=C5A2D8_THEGJ|nr:ribosomal protein S18-alanine N-acetyltransferase [Thermococcus gammatolerans]ACS34557.1 Ribosomal-protein-alanine acetyltransferase (rimI) [Thermococcus gammatolerans EJ3]
MSVSVKQLSGKIPLALVTIRPARLFDISEIMRIERESFREAYPRGLFLVFLENNPETFLVAEYNGKVIGYVMAYLRPDLEGHIMSIAVDERYRGNGIGSALLTEAINRLIARGARYIGLEVRVSNEKAIKLYERFGFRKVKRIIGYYSDGEDAYYMLLPAEEWRGS